LKSSMTLKGQKAQAFDYPGMPKIIFVHKKVADELLKGTGKNLAELQNSIDNELKPHSFLIKGKQIKIKEVSRKEEKTLPNVAGIVEGSDPVLKNEVVIFSGHMDHLGAEGGIVNPGADDDGSGCVALLEMAEAFNSLPKKPLRTVMFLWVSGEEVGLFGSQSYVNNPIYPLDKTVADLNMDMIGRIKSVADSTKDNPMTWPNGVFVITDNQSKELLAITDQVSKKTGLTLDYSLSGRTHPLQLFSILFFTTGIHATYHTPADDIEKIDFKKMELVTKTMYEIGFQVANRKARIIVDNPFSKSKTTGTTPK
jgi:Zn-dependent M28 family amino/carboxypeptidase